MKFNFGFAAALSTIVFAWLGWLWAKMVNDNRSELLPTMAVMFIQMMLTVALWMGHFMY